MNLPLDEHQLETLQANDDKIAKLVRPTREEAEAAVRTLISMVVVIIFAGRRHQKQEQKERKDVQDIFSLKYLRKAFRFYLIGRIFVLSGFLGLEDPIALRMCLR